MRITNQSAEAPLHKLSMSPNSTFGNEQGGITNSSQFFHTIENRQKIQVGSLQNGQITNFQFEKIIKIQSALAFTIVISLFLIIVAMEIKYTHKDQQYQSLVLFCLIFNCANTFVAIIICVIRFLAVLNLEKCRKAIYQNATLFTTKRIVWVFLECIVIILQPYPFLQNLYFQTQNSYQKVKFMYPVNDFMAILSLIRTYIIFRGLILLTPYMNNRSNRLCKMYGCQASFSFSLKCLFKDNPLLLIFILFTTSSLLFSYAVYLAERNYTADLCIVTSTCSFSNALWLILMTITTVGYGDYYPQTPFGRFIIFFVAIWGTFIVSITVVVVSNTLKMQNKEKEASIVIRKLQVREKMKEVAKNFIGYSILKMKAKKIGNQQNARKYSKLSKKAMRQFGSLRKDLKCVRNNNDLYDQLATKFLNLNNDIDVLNENQQKIINYIHQKLEYNERNRNFVLQDLTNYKMR